MEHSHQVTPHHHHRDDDDDDDDDDDETTRAHDDAEMGGKHNEHGAGLNRDIDVSALADEATPMTTQRRSHSRNYGSFEKQSMVIEEELRRRERPKMLIPFKKFGIRIPPRLRYLLTFSALKITVIIALLAVAVIFLTSQPEPDDSDTHLVGISSSIPFISFIAFPASFLFPKVNHCYAP
jgi:hypothetical protein